MIREMSTQRGQLFLLVVTLEGFLLRAVAIKGVFEALSVLSLFFVL